MGRLSAAATAALPPLSALVGLRAHGPAARREQRSSQLCLGPLRRSGGGRRGWAGQLAPAALLWSSGCPQIAQITYIRL